MRGKVSSDEADAKRDAGPDSRRGRGPSGRGGPSIRALSLPPSEEALRGLGLLWRPPTRGPQPECPQQRIREGRGGPESHTPSGRERAGPGVDAQSAPLPRPFRVRCSQYVTKLVLGCLFLYFHFLWVGREGLPWPRGEALLLVAPGAVREGHVRTKAFSPPPPAPAPAGSPAAPRSCLAPGTQTREACCPYLWGNLSRLPLPPTPRHAYHTLHTHHMCTHDIHCIPFARTLSHLCIHKQKKRSRSLRNIFTFTQDVDSPAYTVTQTGTRSCTPRHTRHKHALPSALAVHTHAPLGAHGLPPSGMVGQAGGIRGSQPGRGHGLWP